MKYSCPFIPSSGHLELCKSLGDCLLQRTVPFRKGMAAGHTWFTLLSCRPWNSITARFTFLAGWACWARLPRKTSKRKVMSVRHGNSHNTLVCMKNATFPSTSGIPEFIPDILSTLLTTSLLSDPKMLVKVERKYIKLSCQPM